MARILVADDNADHREFVKSSAERLGHSVTTVKDGVECLEEIDRDAPDLIVTDIFMPAVDGLELILALNDRGSEIPVIAMSGGLRGFLHPYKDIVQMLGGACILRKPFHPGELGAAISRVLDGARKPAGRSSKAFIGI